MNLMWRFLWTFLFARFAEKLSVFDESTIDFYVLPTDIDVLRHLNNGRYFSLMDVARLDFMIRADVFQTLSKNKIFPVVASEMIRFKKSLNLFQRFKIKTRVMGWDDKFFYLMHHFTIKQKVYAVSIVKVAFIRTGHKPITPNDVLDILGLHKKSPVLPEWIKDWQRADQAFYTTTHSH